MRNPYGHLNPLKTEYVANLIKEIDRRVDSPEYNDEIEPLNPEKYLFSGLGLEACGLRSGIRNPEPQAPGPTPFLRAGEQ
jgi:hypothetical protein